jgi:predicted DNA-binding transcriptional regulator AlpA
VNAIKKPTRRKRAVPPGLLRRDDAAAYCGVSPATWDRWTAAGFNPAPRKIAGAVLWNRHELAEWCRRGCPERAEWGYLWKSILDRRTS